MYLPEVYVGLGGNIGDSYSILGSALEKIAQLPSIHHLNVSRFYCTTPVSPIPQNSFINAVCHFKTSLTPQELLQQLQEIEESLGKREKIKEAPRIIDLDILFYGLETIDTLELQIPHPRWSERLFVVAPLADLITSLRIPDPENSTSIVSIDIQKYLQNFPNIHHETVTPIPEILRKLCTMSNLKSFPLAKASR